MVERTKTNKNNNLKKLHEKSTYVNSETVLTWLSINQNLRRSDRNMITWWTE